MANDLLLEESTTSMRLGCFKPTGGPYYGIMYTTSIPTHQNPTQSDETGGVELEGQDEAASLVEEERTYLLVEPRMRRRNLLGSLVL
jgi:hypothetical protein